MLYNAIIRRGHKYERGDFPVVGKLLIRNLNQVPASWIIRFRGNLLERSTDLNSLMCSTKEPIQLYQPRSVDPNTIHVLINTLTGKVVSIYVSPNATIETVKREVKNIEGIPLHKQRYIFCGKQLEDGRKLSDYHISDNTKIHLVLPLRGGGGPGPFSTVNMNADQISGQGVVTATLPWEGFTIGLNLFGKCPLSTCLSNKMKSKLVLQAKYGIIRMTRLNNSFECPACQYTLRRDGTVEKDIDSKEVGMFCPANFLICYGRAIFRYKKAGVDQPVQVVVMESLGCNYEYKKFAESKGSAEYDFIEIITVGPGSSPYYCVVCGDRCSAKEAEEFVLSCGHAYHKYCSPSSAENCFVCDAQQLGGVEDMEDYKVDDTKGTSGINKDVMADRAVTPTSKGAAFMAVFQGEYCDIGKAMLLERAMEKK